MTNERINQVCAEKVMGWKIVIDFGKEWWGQDIPGCQFSKSLIEPVDKWHPTSDRNQARMVVEKAIEGRGPDMNVPVGGLIDFEMNKIVNRDCQRWEWMEATPRDECEAVLRALGYWEAG